MKELYQKLKEFGKVKTNEPLSRHTTFKIGGPADFFVVVEETDKLVRLLKFLDGEGQEYFMLGGGSNLLVNDEGYRGVIIQCRMQNAARLPARQECRMDMIVAEAGCVTLSIAQMSIKEGLTGFEWGVGVPGTIGGAVRGNAGAMGGEMKEVVKTVEVYRDGEVISLNNHRCHFGYRDSMFKHSKDVILRVYLRLHENTESTENKKTLESMKKTLEFLQYRRETQPQGWANTGCIFKNVDLEGRYGEAHRLRLLRHFDAAEEKVRGFLEREKISAGWLIEQAGLKGRKEGQAQVSERHGNFIVNLGGAGAQDVLTLIAEIKSTVYDKFGIELEEEIQII